MKTFIRYFIYSFCAVLFNGMTAYATGPVNHTDVIKIIELWETEGLIPDAGRHRNKTFDPRKGLPGPDLELRTRQSYEVFRDYRYNFYETIEHTLPRLLPNLDSVDHVIKIYSNLDEIVKNDQVNYAFRNAYSLPSDALYSGADLSEGQHLINLQLFVQDQFRQQDPKKLVNTILARPNTQAEGKNAFMLALFYSNFLLFEDMVKSRSNNDALLVTDNHGDNLFEYITRCPEKDPLIYLSKSVDIDDSKFWDSLLKPKYNEFLATLFATEKTAAKKFLSMMSTDRLLERDHNGQNYFNHLVRSGNADQIKEFITEYQDKFEAREWKCLLFGSGKAYQNILYQAVTSENKKSVLDLLTLMNLKELIVKNDVDPQGNSLLHHLAMKHDKETFEAVINNLEKFNSKFSLMKELSATNSRKNSVLDEVIIAGNMSVFSYIVSKKINLPRFFGKESLEHLIRLAIEYRNVSVITELIQQAQKLSEQVGNFMIDGQNLAEYAFSLGHYDIYRILIDNFYSGDIEFSREEIQSKTLRNYLASNKHDIAESFLKSNTFLCRYTSSTDHMNVLMHLLSTPSDPRVTNLIFNLCLDDLNDENNVFLTQNDSCGNNILHLAIKNKKTKFIQEINKRFLFAKAKDDQTDLAQRLINQKNAEGASPIKLLAETANPDLIRASSEYFKYYSSNPLSYPLQKSDSATLFHFLQHFAEIDKKGMDGEYPLETVVKNNDIDSFFILMKRYKYPVIKTKSLLLHVAAKNNSDKLIRPLIEFGIDPNEVNKDGESAVLVAVREGSLEAMKELCQVGADIRLESPEGVSAFNFAQQNESGRLFLRAMKSQTSPRTLNIRGNSILLAHAQIEDWKLSLRKKDIKTIRRFLDQYPLIYRLPVDGPDGRFDNTMHFLISKSDLQFFNDVKKLIKNFNPNEKFEYGKTLFHYAVSEGSVKLINDHLKAGDIDLNAEDDEGICGVVYAFTKGNYELISSIYPFITEEVLAKVRPQSLEYIVVRGDYRYVVDFLFGQSSRSRNIINKVNKHHESPLMVASKWGAGQVVVGLLDRGAKISLQDKSGKTALIHALENRQTIIATELAKKMTMEQIWTQIDQHGNNAVYYALERHQLEFLLFLKSKFKKEFPDFTRLSFGGDHLTATGYAVKFHFEKALPLLLIDSQTLVVNNQGQTLQAFIRLQGSYSREMIKFIDSLSSSDLSYDKLYEKAVKAKAAIISSTIMESGLAQDYKTNLKILELIVKHQQTHDLERALDRVRSFQEYKYSDVEKVFFNASTFEMVSIFVELGFELNTPDQSGNTLLFKAIETENIPLIESLLDHGADIFQQNNAGDMPVEKLVQKSKLVDVLYDHLLAKSKSLSKSFLMSLAHKYNIEMVTIDSLFNLTNSENLVFELSHHLPKSYVLRAIDSESVKNIGERGRSTVSLALDHKDSVEIIEAIIDQDDEVIQTVDEDGLDATADAIRRGFNGGKIHQYLKIFLGTCKADQKKKYQVGPQKKKYNLIMFAIDGRYENLVKKLISVLGSEKALLEQAKTYAIEYDDFDMLKLFPGQEEEITW